MRTSNVVLVLLLGLFLPGRAAVAQAQPHEWLRIITFTDAPVVGADVRVSVHGSKGRTLVDVQTATNDHGVFPVEVPSHPSFLRVSISGGTTNGNPFLGHLTADVVLTDPAHQIAVVNPVTTLVSLVLDERPDLKLDGTEALVRSFLGLPANYSLGMALRQSSGYKSPFFSPVALLKEAEAVGGLDAFEQLLLQNLLASPAATHSFRQPEALGSTESFIAENLAQGALRYAGGQGAGWVMQATGLPTSGATSGSISSLVTALQDLTSAIESLAAQVAQLNQLVKSTATQTQYNTITTTALALAEQIGGHESDLQFFATWCPPLPEGSPPPTTVDPYCTTNFPIVIGELNTEYVGKYYEQVEGYVQDNATLGFEGMIHLYSLWLGESKSFWRYGDSLHMQDLFNYWDSTLTAAANLRMELFHQIGDQNSPAGQAQITAFMGDPDLSPPTTGTFQANEAANQNLMFPAVPLYGEAQGVVISTQDHTMWSLWPWTETSTNPYTFAISSTLQGCNKGSPPGVNVQYLPLTYAQPGSIVLTQGYTGFSDWKGTPTQAQWQAAVKQAPALSSGTDWENFLIAQTETTSTDDPQPFSFGFFNMQTCHFAAWTSTCNSSGCSIILTDKDSFTSFAPGFSDYNYNWPVRTLVSGEQYFWYQ